MATGDNLRQKVGIIPAAQAAGTVNGPAIDRSNARDCVVMVSTGAVTGAPSTQTVAAKIQDSDDGSTGWNDLAGGAVPNITIANGQAELDYGLLQAKKFIRVVSTVSFTGGTAPTIQVAAAVALGDSVFLPA
jgi:hypothetical protein